MKLKQQLDNAIAIYLIDLEGCRTTRGLTDRYSAYTIDAKGNMEVIWPELTFPIHGNGRFYKEGEEEKVHTKEARSQGFAIDNRTNYPKYHFKQYGYGYSKTGEVMNVICRMAGRRIPGFLLTGFSPSPISRNWDSVLDGNDDKETTKHEVRQ